MRLEHHLVGGYVRYISPYIIIINHSNIESLFGQKQPPTPFCDQNTTTKL